MDNLKTLGKLIIGKSEQERDAVHVAIASVTAAETLSPGQHIGFIGTNTETVGPTLHNIGIVDPYLKVKVPRGGRFWMWLYPGTITSLQHIWDHPSFVNPVTGASEVWLREFADSADMSYESLLDAAEAYIKYDDYVCEGGRYEGFYTPEVFWDHYEVVTSKKVEPRKRGNFFSCSC